MKLKSITMILIILLSIVGIAEFTIIFMKLKVPTTMVTIVIILLFIVSISEFMRTRKLRNLAYPIIIIYFLVGMPIIGEFINNRVLYIGLAIVSFVITMIFLYKDLIITNKEKNAVH